jgi:hypothetical protein
VLVGVGVAAIGAGVALLVAGSSKNADADALCAPNRVCPDDATTARADQLASDGYTFQVIGGVALGVGAAAAVGGVLWYALGRPATREAPRASLRWTVAPSSSGLLLGVGGAL